jgi:hypothetical protein
MSWAGRRRALIIAIAALFVFAFLLILFFSIFYKVPTCTDHKQNQDERGIDCGGSCTTLCSFQVENQPTIKLVRAIEPQPGRVDVVAYIENRNTNAQAKGAQFLLEVYGSQQQLIGKRTISVDLPAQMTVPIYVANVGKGEATQAFLTPSDSITWTRTGGERQVLPTIENTVISEGENPRITANLMNPLAKNVYNTTLVATVFDASGNALAASQTLVPTLPSQGSAPIVFTWNAPFSAPVARVEILPVPQLRAP